jgi:hypothetical protein
MRDLHVANCYRATVEIVVQSLIVAPMPLFSEDTAVACPPNLAEQLYPHVRARSYPHRQVQEGRALLKKLCARPPQLGEENAGTDD